MNDTEQVYSEEAFDETEEQQIMSRRDYLLSLKKWSKVVIGSVLLGSASSTMLSGCVAWSDSGGSWSDYHYDDDWTNYRGGTWVNGGGGWLNGGGGWSNGGGGWVNRSGGSGAWKNGGSSGGWKNSGGGSAGWKNSGGSGGWKNSGGGSRSGGWANSSSGSRSTSRSGGGGRSR